tara:strand:+ start:401 stop:808 length:408 start_codon:yes stop_codon:yes gene_type:complete
MSYVEKTIGKNETIIYRVEFHWTYSLIAFLYLLVLGIVLIGIFIFLKMMINKWTTERVLTNERYIQKIGWIRRDTEEISLDRVEEVNLTQSLLGRIFGFGTVDLSGTGSGKIILKYIDEPLVFQKHLNNQRFNED